MIEARIVVLPPGGGKLEIQSVDLPAPAPYAVAVQLKATGICHSQLDHIDAPFPAQPGLLGHEAFGEVVAVGSEVRHVTVGDEVFISWLPRSNDRKGVPAKVALRNGDVAVSRNVYTWGTHCVVDEQYVVKALRGLPADLASIIGCAVMTGAGAVLNSATVEPASSVVVWGVGGVGLCTVAAAHNVGARPVIAVDVDNGKLELALRMGADHGINALEVDPVAAVRGLTGRPDGTVGADYSFDSTGRPDNLPKSLGAVRAGLPGQAGGTNVLVGIPARFELAGMDLIGGQKTLTGCMGGGSSPERDFATFVDWFQTGRLDLAALVTDRYSLDDIATGANDLRNGRIAGRAVVVL